MTSKITKIALGVSTLGLLGLAVVPLSAYADEEAVDVQVVVGSAAQIDDGNTTGANGCGGAAVLTPATIGSTAGTKKCYVTVRTNNAGGYAVSVKYTPSTPASTVGGNGLTTATAEIPAVGTAYTASTLNGATGVNINNSTNVSQWGFNVANQGTETNLGTSYYAAPTAYTTVANPTGTTAGAGYALQFGATVSAAQAQGTYTGIFYIQAVTQ